MLMILLSIILGSMIWSGLNKLSILNLLEKPLWASKDFGIIYINLYKLFILPISAFNGYSLLGYRGFIVAGIGTILGKILIDDLTKNSKSIIAMSMPALQSLIVGIPYLFFTIYLSLFY